VGSIRKVFGAGMGLRVQTRHRLDLSVKDILFGVLSCVLPGRREWLEAETLELCSAKNEGLVCHSVRSGWDLWLGVLDLRAGDEVLVSAVTHPDMVRIIRAHGLRAVPVDIDPETLAPLPSTLEAALTPRTRVVLVAHLFGGRMDLAPVARFAREHGLHLVEDCAQAFHGPESVGDAVADLSMYSFGTLKTATALGGAVLRVGDPGVLRGMREIQNGYPIQRRGWYLNKLLGALGLSMVAKPMPYGLLVRACMWLGRDLDALVNGAVRSFPSREPDATFFQRLRHLPSAPLLAVLRRRLRSFDSGRLARRASAGERFASRLRLGTVHPGGRALRRTHWLFPAVVPDPQAMIQGLRDNGLDASQATSSIAVVEVPAGRSLPSGASLMMSGVVFLPVRPDLPSQALDAMVALVNECADGRVVERVAV
jgi:perosamine synthetase